MQLGSPNLKLEIDMFHDESWKYLWSTVKVTSNKNIAGVGLHFY